MCSRIGDNKLVVSFLIFFGGLTKVTLRSAPSNDFGRRTPALFPKGIARR